MANTGNKSSVFLDEADVLKIARAVDFAFEIGTPLNGFLTINCDNTKIDEAHVHAFITDFLRRAGEWLSFQKGDPPRSYVWVLEKPPSTGVLNLHILIHIPLNRTRRVQHQLRSWLERSGGTWKEDENGATVELKPVRDGGYNVYNHIQDYCYAVNNRARYMLKGAKESICEVIPHQFVHQGHITGKRCGVSESLGLAARRKRPHPARSPSRWHRRVRFPSMVIWDTSALARKIFGSRLDQD